LCGGADGRRTERRSRRRSEGHPRQRCALGTHRDAVLDGQAAIIDLFQNGECTEWAGYKRSDVFHAIVEHIVGAALAAGDNNKIPTGLNAH
jgi:hypothetical protein